MTVITPKTEALLITVSRAAELLCVHPATVRRWIREGKLSSVKLPGGGVRVRAESVTEIVDRGRKRTT